MVAPKELFSAKVLQLWISMVCRSEATEPGDSTQLQAVGGLFAEEAIELLQQFYVTGNPRGACLLPTPLGRCHGAQLI